MTEPNFPPMGATATDAEVAALVDRLGHAYWVATRPSLSTRRSVRIALYDCGGAATALRAQREERDQLKARVAELEAERAADRASIDVLSDEVHELRDQLRRVRGEVTP